MHAHPLTAMVGGGGEPAAASTSRMSDSAASQDTPVARTLKAPSPELGVNTTMGHDAVVGGVA